MTSLPHHACPVVLSAPSGAGKTSVVKALVDSSTTFVFSVSVTTRPRRPSERPHVDYDFVDRASFLRMAERGELCEWAEVHGNLYGTPAAPLQAARERGDHMVLDIDVQGARQVRERVPDAVHVFILPPSADVLVERLMGRGTEASDEVGKRLRTAVEELAVADEFDYVVLNEDLEGTVRRVREIALSEGHRASRVLDLSGWTANFNRTIERLLSEIS